ncbi:MAG: hypothetical protein S4CHLAM20_09120 [Chlamydiia bacterium]|nr:hypothetical protein [Chlamydiia bacterium]
MDTFSKIRKSASQEEQKRQMINKAIDLLHKLANKRMEYSDATAEVSRIVSEYYVIDEVEGVADNAKINLEVMINNAFDVLEGVKNEKLNLYQAIMLMNKVMAHGAQVNKEPKKKVEKLVQKEIEEVKDEIVKVEEKQEAIVKSVSSKSDDLFSQKMAAVIDNKKRLHKSIEELNEVLKGHGFTLSSLEPK